VSMASHEFRTPLTVLQTSVALIEKYAGDDQRDKRGKHIARIRSSISHLNTILEEFLSVSKVEEGKIEPRPAEVDIAQLIGETVADMQGNLKPNQTVQTHLVCAAPVWLDPSLLHKILINLLSNAIKYSGPSSVITLRATCAVRELTLTIEDQGVGISQADQAHLFERFFRANNIAHIAGTGLGLHIVGRYVELMGGRVSLQSVLDQGTTVTIMLPYDYHSAD
jgi:signal transduction histidine kinase